MNKNIKNPLAQLTDRNLLTLHVYKSGGVIRVAADTDIHPDTLRRMMAGTYGRTPRGPLRRRLCAYLKLSELELFPLTAAAKRKVS